MFNLINFTKLHSLLATFVNTQETFQCGLNIVVRVIWRCIVRQCQINFETTLCISKMKFTKLNNVKSTLYISALILKTLYNAKQCCYLERRFLYVDQRRNNVANMAIFKRFKKAKKYFWTSKKRWLIWLTTLAFHCDRLKRKRNLEDTM